MLQAPFGLYSDTSHDIPRRFYLTDLPSRKAQLSFLPINSTLAVVLNLRTSLNCSPVLVLRKSLTKLTFSCGSIFTVGDVILP